MLAWQHGGLSGLCAGISFESAFHAERPALSVSETRELARLFKAFESMLDSSGGPYLFGDVSLADLALVPTLIRLLARSPSLARWPRAAGWAQRLQLRPAVREWMDSARGLPPVHP